MRNEKFRMEHIFKQIDSKQMLRGVSLNAFAGETVGLLGLKDSGKTELMHILSGQMKPDAGRIYLNEKPLDPEEACDKIAYIGKKVLLFDQLSLAENIYVLNGKATQKIRFSRRSINFATSELMGRFALPFEPDLKVGQLTLVQKRMIEVIKAFELGAEVIIIDEITSAYSMNELHDFASRLALIKDQGVSIVFLTLSVEQVMLIGDRISIIKKGRNANGFLRSEFDKSVIAQVLTGHKHEPECSGHKRSRDRTMSMRVDGLHVRGRLNGISFSVRRGEVCGFINYASEHVSDLYDVFDLKTYVDHASIFTGGVTRHLHNSKFSRVQELSLYNGIHFNSQIIPHMTAADNFMLPSIDKYMNKAKHMNRRYTRFVYHEYNEYLGLTEQQWNSPIAHLSMQQKLKIVLYRILPTKAEIVIMNEPISGLDIIMQRIVKDFIITTSERGLSFILCSSVRQQLEDICDAIYLIEHGSIVL
jgi:ABC-type sugar transport system ATPase subunit